MPDVLEKVETSEEVRVEEPWAVMLWDDPVNTMEFVERVLSKVFGYDKARANRVMLAAHQDGRAEAWSGEKEKAEIYCRALHGWGLQATLEKSVP